MISHFPIEESPQRCFFSGQVEHAPQWHTFLSYHTAHHRPVKFIARPHGQVLNEHLTEKHPNHLLSLALNSGFQGLTLTPKALKTRCFFLNFQNMRQDSRQTALNGRATERMALAEDHHRDDSLNHSDAAYIPQCLVCRIPGHQQLKVRQFFVLLISHCHIVITIHQLLPTRHLCSVQPAEP